MVVVTLSEFVSLIILGLIIAFFLGLLIVSKVIDFLDRGKHEDNKRR